MMNQKTGILRLFLASVHGYLEEDDKWDVYKSQLIPGKCKSNEGLSPNETTPCFVHP